MAIGTLGMCYGNPAVFKGESACLLPYSSSVWVAPARLSRAVMLCCLKGMSGVGAPDRMLCYNSDQSMRHLCCDSTAQSCSACRDVSQM